MNINALKVIFETQIGIGWERSKKYNIYIMHTVKAQIQPVGAAPTTSSLLT